MLIKDTYIYKKEIDWSVLHYGINIGVSIQVIFYNSIKSYLNKGETKNIKLIVENQEFIVKLINQNFDELKYPNHKEILQIRYAEKSPIAKYFQEIFYSSYNYIKTKKSKLTNQRIPVSLPEGKREYLVLYTTEFQDTFLVDCITVNDNDLINKSMSELTEEEFELDINYNIIDTSATIEIKQRLVKIRKLDKSICDNLKLLYQYNCQICGFDFGKNYNVNIVEGHHIQSFTATMNNNADNILIICPNHHRMIHKAKPNFDAKNFMFIYSNGLKEYLKLNQHIL
jgi:predicted HNH restriction endonuclease